MLMKCKLVFKNLQRGSRMVEIAAVLNRYAKMREFIVEQEEG